VNLLLDFTCAVGEALLVLLPVACLAAVVYAAIKVFRA
jgi:hypothetical protein